MAAGEFVSVRSQRELLEASDPDPQAESALPHLDVDANELALVYRARGMSLDDADAKAARVIANLRHDATGDVSVPRSHEEVGSALGAALSSFGFFASGALLPVLPYIVGMEGIAAVVASAAIVGVALLLTGAVVGVLSGGPPLRRALRQLAIGYGAAAITYLLGLLFGTSVS
jgi:VIT1/CCC1 family predicted Fe2+/Mn2+ transporter